MALPIESTTGTCFLQHYIESILALQDASCKIVEGLFFYIWHIACSMQGQAVFIVTQEMWLCLGCNIISCGLASFAIGY